LRFNFTRDRFQLRLRRRRADYKKIGEGRDPAQIQDNDIFRLFIRGEFSAGFR
jgi:hypothetical protein